MDFLKRTMLQDMDRFDDPLNPFIPPETPEIEEVAKEQVLIDDIDRAVDMYDDSKGLASRLNPNNKRWGSKE